MTQVPSNPIVAETTAMSITQPLPEYLVYIASADSKPLVTIKPDGTVVIHHPGADVEAAERFYRSLEIRGTTLFQEIERLRAENARLRRALQEAASTLQDLSASCRAFEHNLAATAAEACEQHCRAALAAGDTR